MKESDQVRAIDWKAEYNALSIRTRIIGSAMSSRLQIQHLNREKVRLKARYVQSVKEINSHIKNCEEWLRKLSLPDSPATKEGDK